MFGSQQDAIDFAAENGYQSVFVPQGTYEEKITIYEGIAVFLSHRRGATIAPADGPAVTLEKQTSLQQMHVLLQPLAAESSARWKTPVEILN